LPRCWGLPGCGRRCGLPGGISREPVRNGLPRPVCVYVSGRVPRALLRLLLRWGGDMAGMTDLSKFDFEMLAGAFLKAPKTTVETLSDPEPAIYDILTRPEGPLTRR
jgi:hypothetical protein